MHFIQAWKIFKNKSASDISMTAHLIMLFLILNWLAYGIFINNKTLIFAESLGVIGVTTILIGTFFYG